MYYKVKRLKVRIGMFQCVVCLNEFKNDKELCLLLVRVMSSTWTTLTHGPPFT
ncbi:hypothetical protein MUK42_06663 [Musa troglodytarum]|uniref:Uncharacterized protein n=1 Tax=Musa troglodytarum TaxID=320322 RepID=A0A9E7EIX5_9LILI|nr:hypothetical protein MUK42_06663 [Musa troglodytarum]